MREKIKIVYMMTKHSSYSHMKNKVYLKKNTSDNHIIYLPDWIFQGYLRYLVNI